MATAQEEPTERSLKKEVVMVGYFNEQNLDMDRFKTLVTGTDLETKETRTDEWWDFDVDMTEVFSTSTGWISKRVYLKEDKEVAVYKLDELGINYDVEHTKEVEEETINSEYQAIKDMMEELAEYLPNDLVPSLYLDTGARLKYRDHESMQSIITIGRPEFDKRRVHAKEGERSENNMYETVGDYPSVSFHITLEAESEAQMDLYTEKVIVNLHKALAKREGIGKVRYISCTTQEERHGECYAF